MGEKKQDRVRWELLLIALIPIGIIVASYLITHRTREPEAPLPPLTSELLVAMAADPAAVHEGTMQFRMTCVACHGGEGQGIVGPNLTDDVWLHGSSPLEIHTSISKGFPEKGMSPFANLLGEKRVRWLTAYVLSIKGKNLKGRPPEGI